MTVNQTEAVKMLYVLTRAGLVRAMDDQGAVWAAALPEVRIEDAMTITEKLVREHTGADRWVTPGDIIAGVKQLRLGRHDLAARDGAGTVQPPESIDPDDIQGQITWRKAFNQAIGDGHDVNEADAIACRTTGSLRQRIGGDIRRPVTALVQTTASAMPTIPSRGDAA